MEKHRQLRLTLQSENAARLSREKEQELIEALAELILTLARTNDGSNASQQGGGDERKDP